MKQNKTKKILLVGALTLGILIVSLMVSNLIPSLAYNKNLVLAKNKKNRKVPKNIIVMISDGCGYNQINAASLYQYGKTGQQIYEKFPVKYAMSTYPADGSYDPDKAEEDLDYVINGATDSAAASTAMSSGIKTYGTGVGVNKDQMPVENVIERAEKLGKSTGVVTSVVFSHATPAGFVAHNINRDNFQAISKEMLLASKTEVIMGAGNPWYDDNGEKVDIAGPFDYVGGPLIWESLVDGTLDPSDADGDGLNDKWTLIQTKEEFTKLTSGTTPKRVLGIPQVATTLQQARGGNTNVDPYVIPLNLNVPALSDMAKGALNVLDNNDKGFLLMIEGGATDWACHNNQAGRVIEEQIAFNESVEAVVEWVNKNSNWQDTLLIVTGDHETGYITGPGSYPKLNPLVNNGKGNIPGMQWNSTDHTNSLVPLFAKGVGARLLKHYADEEDPVRGKYIDNTEIAKLIFAVYK